MRLKSSDDNFWKDWHFEHFDSAPTLVHSYSDRSDFCWERSSSSSDLSDDIVLSLSDKVFLVQQVVGIKFVEKAKLYGVNFCWVCYRWVHLLFVKHLLDVRVITLSECISCMTVSCIFKKTCTTLSGFSAEKFPQHTWFSLCKHISSNLPMYMSFGKPRSSAFRMNATSLLELVCVCKCDCCESCLK